MAIYPSQHEDRANGGYRPLSTYNTNNNMKGDLNQGSNGHDTSNALTQYSSQQQRNQQHDSQISGNKTSRDPAAQRRLAMQLEYQRTLAQLNHIEDVDTDYSRTSSETDRQSHHIYSEPSSKVGEGAHGIEYTIGHLNLASPTHYSAHGQTVPSPSITSSYTHTQHLIPQPQHHDASVNAGYQSQQHTTTTTYPSIQAYHHDQQHQQQRSSQYFAQQQQQRVLNASYDQHLHRNSLTLPSQLPLPYPNGHPYSPSASTKAQLLIDFNPGILSTIAVAFRQRMLDNEAKRSESTNYGLEFPVTFTGKEAVDVIVELTHLEDRRHALSIARSLENQFLFFGGGDHKLFDSNNDQYFFSDPALAYLPGKSDFPTVPRGVFPCSTRCYSYGCVPEDPTCYSYLCPNRRRAANSLGRQNSDVSSQGSQEKVWANSVPASVVAAASKRERDRQEAIFEVVTTESNYVRDLELMEEIFIKPLRSGDIIESEKVEEFIEDVFLNYKEIHDLNKKLLEQLRVRQEEQPLVEKIGDILLTHVIGFEEAYSKYIPRIALSEFISKKEEARNPKYAQFLKECTRHPEARRLGLLHFVGQPYQRIPRYPLLLNEVIKKTDENVEDRQTVQEVIKVCTVLGKKIDECMPESALRLRLLTIQDKIVWKSNESEQDLKLNEKTRRLLFECIARRRATFDVQATEFRIFVFDHMLVITKEKKDKLGEKDAIVYQVYKKPIPLELANVYPDDGKPASLSARDYLGSRPRSKSTTVSATSEGAPLDPIPGPNPRDTLDLKFAYPVTIYHRGKRGREFMFYMTSSDRDELVEQVSTATTARQEAVSSNLFQLNTIVEMSVHQSSPSAIDSFDGKRVTCSALYLNVVDGRRRIVVGTDNGIFVGMDDDPSNFWLVLKDLNVTDISILEDHHLLLVLSGKILKAYNMNCLEPNSDKSFQAGHQIAKNIQYFTAGVYSGKTLIIAMKKKGTGAGESQFSAFEPLEGASMGTQSSKGLGGLSLGRSKPDWFKLYREFYVASESSQLQMFSKNICVVCPRGFEVLKLDNLVETRVYPTKQDAEYAFLLKRPDSVPVSMFKINSDQFLMCYSDFAFIMTKNGNLAKTELIEFEGRAESFALVYPYIIAFESQLIEIRHIETGTLEQLVLGDNIRVLYTGTDPKGNTVIHVLMSHPTRGDVRQVVKLAKVQPTTILEPVKYQPKSSYTPQTTTNSTSSYSPIPQAASPYSVHRQASPLHVDIPLTPHIPQRPSPRMTQQPIFPSTMANAATCPATPTTYPVTTVDYPTAASPYSAYRSIQTSQPHVDISSIPPIPQRPSPRMAQQQPIFPSPMLNAVTYPATTTTHLSTTADYPTTPSTYSATPSYSATGPTYPMTAASPIYSRATAVYPPTSAYGNAHGAGYQPTAFDSEPVYMAMPMPMPMPTPDVTTLHTPAALPLHSPTIDPAYSPNITASPYAPVNSMPYPQYPQVYSPQASGYRRSPSPSSQQTWTPTGFL
ncbi:RHO1 GDP-GTP exchange protein 2 [Mortierella sp. AD011]|nr:RHO1 GDP-GTP exchange protein 2 [Mortierella sp. AD011]